MKILSVKLMLLAAFIGGCTPMYTKPIIPPPSNLKERNFITVWDSCRETLKNYGYELDRTDKRDGVITTYATPGGQFFEFWRKDSATTFNWRENTLQTILRAVRIQIKPIPHSDNYSFTIEVAMARSDKGAPVVTSTGDETRVIEYGGVVDKIQSKRMYQVENPMSKLTFNDLLHAPEPENIPLMARERTDRNPASMVVPMGRDHDLESRISASIEQAVSEYDFHQANKMVTW